MSKPLMKRRDVLNLGISWRLLRKMEDAGVVKRVYPLGTDPDGKPIGHGFYKRSEIKEAFQLEEV